MAESGLDAAGTRDDRRRDLHAGRPAPTVLGEGDAPAISPDGARVAFVHDPDQTIWSAPIDGSKPAKPLFFDRGKDGDLQWSPDGKALAFTSDRDDHSFAGIYRNDATPIEYLAPTTFHDSSPQWSPDGDARRVRAHARRRQARPKIRSCNIRNRGRSSWPTRPTGAAHTAWQSGNGLRDSLPGINGPQLRWIAGDRLAFISEQSNWPNLYAVPARGGKATFSRPVRS